jgi:hypothetical protein
LEPQVLPNSRTYTAASSSPGSVANVVFAYYKQSGLSTDGILSLAPNLSREPVSFDAELREPLRFREAISALHDVVINDLRFKPRDKSAYEAYKQAEHRRLANIRTTEYKAATEAILARRAADVPRDLESRFEKHRRTYWDARQRRTISPGTIKSFGGS